MDLINYKVKFGWFKDVLQSLKKKKKIFINFWWTFFCHRQRVWVDNHVQREGKLKCKRELLLIQGWVCAEVHIVIPECNIEGFHHLSLAISRLIVCTFVSYWQRKTVCFPTILEFRGGALPYKRDRGVRVKIRGLVPLRALKSKLTSVRGMAVPFRVSTRKIWEEVNVSQLSLSILF